MDLSREEQLLIVDFQASLDLLQHEDGRKSHMYTIFFLVQGALFGFYSLVLANSLIGAIAAILMAFVASMFWYYVMERMQGFVELRYHHLQHLEAMLGTITTITNEEKLRSEGAVKIGDFLYELPPKRNRFSISKQLESRLPVVIGIFWVIVFFATIFRVVP